MTTNNLKKLDEFTFFKQQFAKLHANLNRVLSSQKVENETRNIFKIKRGTS
jgi:trans-2-enoyl-CoA reductase